MQVSLLTHDLFANDPFSEREAWLWIISQAAWKDTKHRVGKKLYDVKEGTFFSTVRHMQVSWKWSSTRRVYEFLNMLKAETMIETRTETGKTLISVCNYKQYQSDYGNSETGFETETETELKHKRYQYTNIDNSLRSLSLGDAPKKQRKTGTRLPDDWEISEALTKWIRSKKYSRSFVLHEIEKFKNYWHAKSGKDATKLDWDATARNWLLKASERNSGAGVPTTIAGAAALAKREFENAGHEFDTMERQQGRSDGCDGANGTNVRLALPKLPE